jgi:SAM-dependent MidA family methyltransferase
MTADDRSHRLRHQIRAEIRAAGGAIPFARFMELALYAPNLGYYETDSRRVGRGGDFYTSVSTGPLFGELLAWQCLDWIARQPNARTRRWTLLECGAHDGTLARDILTALDAASASASAIDPALVQQIDYVLMEPSLSRRAWQESALAPWSGRVRWINTWPAEGIHGVILSNELLDAFPVHRIGWSASARDWFEWGVAAEGDAFSWVRISREVSNLEPHDWPEIPSELADVLPDGFTTEVGPAAAAWWTNAANVLCEGWMITFDYGLDRIEFLQPQRDAGTLRAYRNHILTGDLLADPGDQDLTAQVDFTAIAKAGESAGLETLERTSQRRWLTEVLQRRVKQPGSESWLTPERIRQFQTLTHPQHLGRGFSVLVQRRAGGPIKNSE